jgi:hypothetical protein
MPTFTQLSSLYCFNNKTDETAKLSNRKDFKIPFNAPFGFPVLVATSGQKRRPQANITDISEQKGQGRFKKPRLEDFVFASPNKEKPEKPVPISDTRNANKYKSFLFFADIPIIEKSLVKIPFEVIHQSSYVFE